MVDQKFINDNDLNSTGLITIHSVHHVELLVELTSFLQNKAVTASVCALELSVHEHLKEAGIENIFIGDLVDDILYENLDQKAMSIANGWYTAIDNKDFSVFAGISIADLYSWEFSYFFADVLRCYINAEELIRQQSPNWIISLVDKPSDFKSILLQPEENFHTDAFAIVGREKNIPVFECRTHQLFPIGQEQKHGRIQQEITENGEKIRPLKKTIEQKLIWNAFETNAKHSKKTSDKYRILFTSDFFTGGSLQKVLMNDNRFQLLSMGKKTESSADGIEYVTDKALSVENDLIRNIHHFWGLIWHNNREILYEKLDSYLPLLSKFPCVRKRIGGAVNNLFPDTLIVLQRISKFLVITPVDLIITHTDVHGGDKFFVRLAHYLNINTLLVIHGALSHPIGAVPVLSDKVAVYGEDTRELLETLGVEPGKIEVSGAPKFKKPGVLLDPASKNVLVEKLQLNPDSKIVLVTLQHCNRSSFFPNVHWQTKHWRKMVYEVCEAARELDDIRVIVKSHPNDHEWMLWPGWLKKTGLESIVTFCFDIPFQNLLSTADVVVTGWSTTVLEAAAAGVPVLCVNLTDRPDQATFTRKGLTLGARNRPEIREGIRTVLKDKNGQFSQNNTKIYKHFVVAEDVTAAENIHDLVISMLSS